MGQGLHYYTSTRVNSVILRGRVHLGSFGPSMVTQFRDFSMVGPHGGSDSGDLAKIVPGATRVILIPNTENTHFGNDYES